MFEKLTIDGTKAALLQIYESPDFVRDLFDQNKNDYHAIIHAAHINAFEQAVAELKKLPEITIELYALIGEFQKEVER